MMELPFTGSTCLDGVSFQSQDRENKAKLPCLSLQGLLPLGLVLFCPELSENMRSSPKGKCFTDAQSGRCLVIFKREREKEIFQLLVYSPDGWPV